MTSAAALTYGPPQTPWEIRAGGRRRSDPGPIMNSTILRLTWLLVLGSGSSGLGAQLGDSTDYLEVGFDRISDYIFTPPFPNPRASASEHAAAIAAAIPQEVRRLDGRRVVITGFMLPVKMEKGLVTEFLLMRDATACCFGTMPDMNEWVIVRMAGEGVRSLMEIPVRIHGILAVGPVLEDGFLAGIYSLVGERVSR